MSGPRPYLGYASGVLSAYSQVGFDLTRLRSENRHVARSTKLRPPGVSGYQPSIECATNTVYSSRHIPEYMILGDLP
jgi:hypothetical protein